MSEVKLRKGEPVEVDKALRRLKKKRDRERTLLQVRASHASTITQNFS